MNLINIHDMFSYTNVQCMGVCKGQSFPPVHVICLAESTLHCLGSYT